VHALDLYVDEPIATHDRSVDDIPDLMERVRTAMATHLRAAATTSLPR